MTPHDAARAASPGLPRRDEGPVFDEPWQAQAFALVIRLHETGCFTWPEWTAALTAEIAKKGHEDGHYYVAWLAALESLVLARNLLERAELERRKAAWTDAHLSTPHGQPVVLSREVSHLPN